MNNIIQTLIALGAAALGIMISPALFGVFAGLCLIVFGLLQYRGHITTSWSSIMWLGLGCGIVITSPRAFTNAETTITVLQFFGNLLIVASGAWGIFFSEPELPGDPS